jgi:hypothetical protein
MAKTIKPVKAWAAIHRGRYGHRAIAIGALYWTRMAAKDEWRDSRDYIRVEVRPLPAGGRGKK